MVILYASEYILKTLYDCSFLSEEEWWKEVYIPIGFIFLKKEFLQLTCYKFMLLLFLLDEICLSGCSIFSGIMAIQGAVFCNHPKIMWIFGLICISSWGSCCSLCVFMALNRCLDIVNPAINNILFHGKKAFIWMILSLIYGFYIGTLNQPMFFSSKMYGWFYNPYFGTNLTNLREIKDFSNYPHIINNFLVVIILTSLYAYFCFSITLKYKLSKKFCITRAQKNLFIQATIICLLNFCAAILYIYIQFIPADIKLAIVAHMAWIFTHGFSSFIYLIFNKQIRQKIFNMICFIKITNSHITVDKITQFKSKVNICNQSIAKSNTLLYK
ncbi:7TM GPCR, serpentine receptor class t (Srt) family-containing protein [Strongyloides ratti]|uniref:7TM GPCR, serpentine receptor class t (Srt) family-containing protein n=1 Tax=Strongyloides ratti TaxID=34506 RepID=A0A090KTP6_STRRB|nr:7TM GPCR, serpentine receptor class t (Srt) family-containing protein [Strongyloides ratti]CEF60895.1 7TM GPCR, serpentine receptor class t (Srt) family-containing protein [Strongyloides ratti]